MKSKIVLIFIVVIWALSSALQNIIDWNATVDAVVATTSMVTIEGGADSWKAISHPILAWAGAVLILLSKILSGGLCTYGAIKMWIASSSDLDAYRHAKNIALTGCVVAVGMLFGGFIVIAEGWFELWQSEVLRAPVIESAFRYACMVSLIALIVAVPEIED